MLAVGLVHVVVEYRMCIILNSLGERRTPVLNWRCVSECSLCFTSFDVVCSEFEYGGLQVCVG